MSVSDQIKSLARSIGFDLVGIAKADPPSELGFFTEWVARGYAGEMSYLFAQVAQRSDLRVAFPWAQSLIAVGLQYDTPHPYSTEAPADRGWISRYAWGDDYHVVLTAMLDRLIETLKAEFGNCEARRCVDTGPIHERAYAAAAGLGAWGKNTCLLHPEHGSWFFLGAVVTDLVLPPDSPRSSLCGRCTACLDACPTHALVSPHVMDSRRCISYLTIEARSAFSEELRPLIGRHVFGCDICQDVCPWNRKRRHRGIAAFEPRPGLFAPDLEELAGLDEDGFRSRFRHSPVTRAKRRGLVRNAAVAAGNLAAGDPPAAISLLQRLARDLDPFVREHAIWALARRSGAGKLTS